MKHTFIASTTSLASAMLLIAANTHAQTANDSQRIDQLEQQVRGLQQQAAKPETQRVRFNGFLSVAYGSADNDAGYAGYDEDYDLDRESLFGLQGTFVIDSATDVTMQLVARGREDWDPTMEWAYISHKFSNEFKARAGKMRLPLFMFSDSLEVGYAQPWARPPIEVYEQVSPTYYTGVDGIYDWNLANSTFTAQVFTGASSGDITSRDTTVPIELNDIYGGSLAWTDFTWTLRGIYSGSTLVVNGADGTDGAFYGVGLNYNSGNWQVLSEITRVEIDGPIPDSQAAYVTLTKRFGAFTPYVTYAITETKDDDERPLSRAQAFTLLTTPGSPYYDNTNILAGSAVSNFERSATSIGVRWDAMTNVALKFDVTLADDFGDTGGGLDGNSYAPTVQYDDTTVFTVKLDAAF
jgi:hypothetical protein